MKNPLAVTIWAMSCIAIGIGLGLADGGTFEDALFAGGVMSGVVATGFLIWSLVARRRSGPEENK